MTDIIERLPILLKSVSRPGDFYTTGTVDMAPPALNVEGVGQIALPLLPFQAEQIIAVAKRAPFGRGEQTIIDPDVRRTWQISPEQMSLGGKNWQSGLQVIVERIAHGLGVDDAIEAEFYKLLIYDEGSFFLSHRDTEKTPGMFGTLVLALPGSSEGGELIVRHVGREVSLDLCRNDPGELAYAAFYADCVHEVRPVTAGHRLTLIYNLVRAGKKKTPEAPNYDKERDQIAQALRGWRAALEQHGSSVGGDDEDEDDGNEDYEDEDDDIDGGPPLKLVYPLQHAYTPAELTFAALKGADSAAAKVLIAASAQAGCNAHLALLTIEESGSAEYTGYGYRRYGAHDEDEFEVAEVFDKSLTLSHWRASDDSPAPFHVIPVEEEEISPPDIVEDMDPDDEEFHEATGNEGASFDRTYRRAALVLWPMDREFDIVLQAGLASAVVYLEGLIVRAAGEGREAAASRAAAIALTRRIVASWPPGAAAPIACRMLKAWLEQGDLDLVALIFSRVITSGAYQKDTVPELITGLGALPGSQRIRIIQDIIVQAAVNRRASGALFMMGLIDDLSHVPDAIGIFVGALPTEPQTYAYRDAAEAIDTGFVVNLVTALAMGSPEFAIRAVDHMLAFPGAFPLDALLVPAGRELALSASLRGNAAVETLLQACRAHLQGRIAEPLAPPADWRRSATISCKCEHCRSLNGFLADAGQREWLLRAAQHFRSHVEDQIRYASCDLDCSTLRKGSPHTLVCTKNQASYEARARQRQEDLAAMAALASK